MRVLLVEDHLQLAASVAQALKSAGWTVDVLHDGVAADLALREARDDHTRPVGEQKRQRDNERAGAR